MCLEHEMLKRNFNKGVVTTHTVTDLRRKREQHDLIWDMCAQGVENVSMSMGLESLSPHLFPEFSKRFHMRSLSWWVCSKETRTLRDHPVTES